MTNWQSRYPKTSILASMLPTLCLYPIIIKAKQSIIVSESWLSMDYQAKTVVKFSMQHTFHRCCFRFLSGEDLLVRRSVLDFRQQ